MPKAVQWLLEAPAASKISTHLFLLFEGFRTPILARQWATGWWNNYTGLQVALQEGTQIWKMSVFAFLQGSHFSVSGSRCDYDISSPCELTFRDKFDKLESVLVIFQVQSGGGGWKILIVGHRFSGIFDHSWPNLIRHSGYCSKAYNSCNHGHAPGQHMWQSLGQRPNSKCSKKVREELKLCQCRIAIASSDGHRLLDDC